MHFFKKKDSSEKDEYKIFKFPKCHYKDVVNNKRLLMIRYWHEKHSDPNGDVRIFLLENRKKYVCVDADDKKSNDHVSYIMKKYNIKDNCYPSISNYFFHDYGENAHKYHYWFETDIPVTSHIHINNTLLDVWGPRGDYTKHPYLEYVNRGKLKVDSDTDNSRIIFEPNVEGMYLDTSKKYPLLTNEIYHDIMNINLDTSLFSNKAPSCTFHYNCIAFEKLKHKEMTELGLTNMQTNMQNKNSSVISSQPWFNLVKKLRRKDIAID